MVRAQEAGAVGVIVTDEDTDNDELFISMADDTTGREATIPAAFVLGKNGYRDVRNKYPAVNNEILSVTSSRTPCQDSRYMPLPSTFQ